MFNYLTFCEIRDILAVGKSQKSIIDDENGSDHLFSNKEHLDSLEEDYKNADVLYWLYDNYWL